MNAVINHPIRVLQMIGSLNIGGSQSMIINLYNAIDRSKVQFDFIVDKEGELYYEDTIKKLGGKIYLFPTFNGKNIKEIRTFWEDFLTKHKEYRILHSHIRSYASIYIPIAKKHGLKTIIHSHSTSNGSGVSAFAKKVMQYPLRFQADYFFSCSTEAGKWLFGQRIIHSDKYYMLQNAIDLEKYVFDDSMRVAYRKEFGLSSKTKVFIHVGRLHPAKNHMFLLDIMKSLNTFGVDAVLLLIGDGKLREDIEEEIKSKDLTNVVKLLGARNDVPNLLNVADAFLFPSQWEGLPVTVVEAQASGLKCFISDRVTKDVVVSNLVTTLPINQGVKPWVDAIKNADLKRIDASDQIRKAGFDINASARWIENFYLSL